MSATPARAADRLPLPGLPNPPARPRRADAAAVAGVAAVAAHILLAPATGVLTAGAVLAGWLTRWRPLWLTGPAAAGAVWTAAIGPWRAAAGLIAGPRLLLAYLAAVPGHPAHLQAAGTVLAQAAHLLPGQLPAGLLAASAEAAGLARLAGRRRARGERHGAGGHGAGRPAGWRPGLIAIVRRYRTRAVLAAGHTATRTGFCLGLDPATGRPAELSWAAAGGGVLVSCAGPDAAARLSFPAAGAALARRMTLIVIDLTASDWLAADLAAACATAAVPLTRLRPAPPGHWVAAQTGSAPLASAATTSAATISAATISAATASAAAGSPQPAGADLSSAISQAVRNREVVVAALEPAIPARAAAAVAEQAASSLTAALRGLRTQELRGDCLAWVHGCEVARPLTLARLLELGPGTGTAILLSTASDAAAALLADRVAAVVAGGPVGERLAVRLAVRSVTDLADGMSPASGEPVPRLRRQLADEFTIADARAGLRPGLRPACRQVAPARAQRARMAAEQITRGQPARGQRARGQPAPGQPAPGRAPRAGNR